MKTVKIFFSGVAVYLSVASIHACGGTDSLPTWATSSASGGGATGAGGAPMVSTSSAGTGGKTGHGGSGGMTNPVADALAESGSRLKAQWLTGDDGSKSFAGFYDSARQEACSFLDMSDGVKHCIPWTGQAFNVDTTFLDASCVTPIAVAAVVPCMSTPKYGYSYYDLACPSGPYKFRIFSIGAKFTLPTVYSKASGSCVGSAPSPSAVYHLLGSEIPPSSFVAAGVTTDS